jgi:erythromycin esterase-like protein
MQFVAADSSDHLNRDQHMAETIQNILSDDQKNKVVFWVGAGHAVHSSPGARTCLDILDEKLGYQNKRQRFFSEPARMRS